MPLPELDSSVGHSFGLEFDSVLIKRITEVSGLKMEQDVIELKQNTADGKYAIKKLPGRPKAGEVTVTRGLTEDNSFEKWIKDSRFGKMTNARRNGVDHRLRLRGPADQALQADQRLAQVAGDQHPQGGRHLGAHREAVDHLRERGTRLMRRVTAAPARADTGAAAGPPSGPAAVGCGPSSPSSCPAGTWTPRERCTVRG